MTDKKEFSFGFEQRTIGPSLVCSCCNEIVATGAPRLMRAEHALHDHCANKFDKVIDMKPEVEQLFELLPVRFFEKTDLRKRLARACTFEAMSRIIGEFCKMLRASRSWLKGTVDEVTEQVRAFGERTRMRAQIEAYLSA